MKSYILFDLDGTLTDPKEGICTCVQYALKSFGIDEPDLDKLEPFIGPPLKDSFMKHYNFTEEQAQQAIEKYRERFRDTGIFENELYGGIHNMLRQLKAAGMHLAVASSKPEVFVERILEHFKLDQYFEVVVGSELDGSRVDKAEIIDEAMHRFFPDGKIHMDQVYMVGDRSYDVVGAHNAGAEAVGVTYGYGSMEELKEAKCDYIVQSVEELRKFLLREARELEEAGRVDPQNPGKAQTPDGKLRFTSGDLWRIVYLFLIFMVVRFVAEYLLSLILSTAAPYLGDFFIVREDGVPTGFTGNTTTLIAAVAYTAGAAAIYTKALKMIHRTADDMRLEHLLAEPRWTYLLMGLATVGSVIGLNLLLELVGFTEKSAAYQAVQEDQYSAVFLLGLVVYGFITPIAEELVFRGLIYNYLRAFFRTKIALFLGAAVFGFYHLNSVQGMYAFLMGMLMIYAYEYFGSFLAPVLIHVGSNVLSYCLTYTVLGSTAFVSGPVCALALAAAGISLLVLHRRKEVLH